jgi:hypothetical protein
MRGICWPAEQLTALQEGLSHAALTYVSTSESAYNWNMWLLNWKQESHTALFGSLELRKTKPIYVMFKN